MPTAAACWLADLHSKQHRIFLSLQRPEDRLRYRSSIFYLLIQKETMGRTMMSCRMMTALAGAAVVLLAAEHAEGFVGVPQSMPSTSTTRCMALPTPEESAKALSEYMAKSHEEKLRAVKEVEDKKAAEIKALKEEMEELKQKASSSTSEIVLSAATAPALGSSEEMAAKLAAYQKFMAEYVVKAQESKVMAVQEAEKNAELKFMEKYQLMLGPASAAAAPVAVVIGSNEYQVRNAHIQKAAAAGKSRWGDLENQKAAGQVPSRPHVDGVAGPALPAMASTPFSTVPPQVQEADHGLRADGGVGGLTLAERVTQGSASAAAPVAVVIGSNEYQVRNAHIQKAAAAGKSRWGDLENQKAAGQVPSRPHVDGVAGPALPAMASTPVSTVPPQVQEANHGLRADGGVGGLTLAERVTQGASAAAAAPVLASPTMAYYAKRTASVAAAGMAGKSRWGGMEISKASSWKAPSISAAAAAPVSVEEANHGLRADGGVGGPSLSERVNLGAKILQSA